MEGLEGGTFVSFGPEPIVIEFLENTPRKRKNTWGKDVWDWRVQMVNRKGEVISTEMILSTASMRLRRGLAGFAPLLHKVLRIERTGEKMDTKYLLQEVNKGNTKLP